MRAFGHKQISWKKILTNMFGSLANSTRLCWCWIVGVVFGVVSNGPTSWQQLIGKWKVLASHKHKKNGKMEEGIS